MSLLDSISQCVPDIIWIPQEEMPKPSKPPGSPGSPGLPGSPVAPASVLHRLNWSVHMEWFTILYDIIMWRFPKMGDPIVKPMVVSCCWKILSIHIYILSHGHPRLGWCGGYPHLRNPPHSMINEKLRIVGLVDPPVESIRFVDVKVPRRELVSSQAASSAGRVISLRL